MLLSNNEQINIFNDLIVCQNDTDNCKQYMYLTVVSFSLESKEKKVNKDLTWTL